jgi:hypothetical protein
MSEKCPLNTLVERLREVAGGSVTDEWPLVKLCDEAADALSAATRELAALREGVPRDAARYRWLRAKRGSEWAEHTHGWIHVAQAFPGHGRVISEGKLDAVIDAALAQEGTPRG